MGHTAPVILENFNAGMFLASSTVYENITITQFQTWNVHLNLNSMREGEAVCIGSVKEMNKCNTVAADTPYKTTWRLIHPSYDDCGSSKPDSLYHYRVSICSH
jgi:hypothetical protein